MPESKSPSPVLTMANSTEEMRDRLDLAGPWTPEREAELRAFFAGATRVSVWAWRDRPITADERAARSQREAQARNKRLVETRRFAAQAEAALSTARDDAERWRKYLAGLELPIGEAVA